MIAKALMIQGTGSGVGKSILTAAFCRWLYLRGHKVAPFKAQNMSLNSFVTEDGGEIGRAQAYQAEACGIAPHVAMNPILLKPSGDNRSQVIVMGKPAATLNARQYYGEHKRHLGEVLQALEYLKQRYEWIVLEGAGSPAEINLRDIDLVNMAMAQAANAPVLLVGDIDRGGVFAWMKGTYDLLKPEEQSRVAGFIINKFRGDLSLLQPGIEMFEQMVEKPVLGVVPFVHDFFVDEEDAIPQMLQPGVPGPSTLDVAILRLPRISNFTDFAPLVHDTSVTVRYVWQSAQLGNPDLIILPGTKNTLADCLFLHEQGLDAALREFHRAGVPIFGVCGGFQMLGTRLKDPDQTESSLKDIPGLGFLEFETTLQPEKLTRQLKTRTAACPLWPHGLELAGFEIHMGVTVYRQSYCNLFDPDNHPNGHTLGICDDSGLVAGTYLHGLFDSDPVRESFLASVRRRRGYPQRQSGFDYAAFRSRHLDQLADLVEQHIDHGRVLEMMTVK